MNERAQKEGWRILRSFCQRGEQEWSASLDVVVAADGRPVVTAAYGDAFPSKKGALCDAADRALVAVADGVRTTPSATAADCKQYRDALLAGGHWTFLIDLENKPRIFRRLEGLFAGADGARGDDTSSAPTMDAVGFISAHHATYPDWATEADSNPSFALVAVDSAARDAADIGMILYCGKHGGDAPFSGGGPVVVCTGDHFGPTLAALLGERVFCVPSLDYFLNFVLS